MSKKVGKKPRLDSAASNGVNSSFIEKRASAVAGGYGETRVVGNWAKNKRGF